MQNLIVMFNFFRFRPEISFLGKYDPKIQNYHCLLKFNTLTNSSMQISMVMFSFSELDQKYPFSANLVQTIKVISLR